MIKRSIIRIDEELCDGCGKCVLPCAEGAIKIVDGKARVVDDSLCDGAGFCLGVCPMGALEIIEREALPFDEVKAQEEKSHQQPKPGQALSCSLCGLGEDAKVLIPIREKGDSKWVCVSCLPGLIHG